MTGAGVQGLLAVALVLALVGVLAWMARRGGLARFQTRGPLAIETAVPLGDRRMLVIVAVEGRRLLLGMTPMQVSLLTELGAAPPAPAFDRELEARR